MFQSLERDRGIEPLLSVWKTEVITTIPIPHFICFKIVFSIFFGPQSWIRTRGFTDLQSGAMDRSANCGCTFKVT